MKKSYILKNLHCADCARSLEEVIQGFDGVKHASINFVTERFELEVLDHKFEEVLTKIKKLVKDFGSNVVMIEEEQPLGDELFFHLKGLSSLSSAVKIEETIKKLKEVNSCSIENYELKIGLNCKENENLTKRIKSLIKNIEPLVKIKKSKNKVSHIDNKIVFYPLGLVSLILVILNNYSVLSINAHVYWLLLIGGALLLGYQTYLTAIKMLINKSINENLLVTISVFGAIVIGEHMEALMVVALYTLGKMLEAKAVNKSRKDIQALMNIAPEKATILENNEEKEVRPQDVKIGQIVVVKPGQKVAIDGIIENGQTYIDAQSLTGESQPIYVSKGEEILSGVTIIDGRIEIKTTKVYSDSTTSKILDMIEKASEKKSKTETFIARFSKYYTMLVVSFAMITGVITWLVLKDVSEALYRGLVFLVISCPCAFAISVPLSYFSGIGNASRKGILIKGTSYLDKVASAKIVAFDKTGTLTTGEFVVKKVEVIEDAYTKEEIINIAAIGEQNSIHLVAQAIVKSCKLKKIPQPDNFIEIAGEGISFEIDGTEYFVGRDEDHRNLTTVVVKKGNITIGKIYLEDSVKADSKSVAIKLKQLGVKTIILSGDKKEVAEEVAKELNVDEVHAKMLPQDKFDFIEKTIKNNKKNEKLVYVGDGINDAPSLAVADVGVSMGINGSPASIEASDIVLIDDNPSKIVSLIRLSKFTKRIVIQNIIFAGVIKLAFLILGAIGLANMVMAVFADVGVTILAILNSLRVLKHK